MSVALFLVLSAPSLPTPSSHKALLRPGLPAAHKALPRNVCSTRRCMFSVVLPLLSVPLPQSASAGLFGNDGPQDELRQLVTAQRRMLELAAKLRSGDLRGERDDDAIVVLQTVTIQFGGTPELMTKTAASMSRLDATGMSKAQQLSEVFASALGNVRAAVRERDAEQQLAATSAAGSALGEFLLVAASQYKVPTPPPPAAYSSDTGQFMAQYFGFLSCEGQGLDRVPGSNSCTNPVAGGKK